MGEEFGPVLLAGRETLQQELPRLSSSGIYAATTLAATAARRYPALLPLLSLLQQQLQLRAANA